jgi:hypothetical protein
MLGHALDGSVAVGDPARTGRVAGGYSLNRSTEEVRSILPYTSGSDKVRLSVTRAFFRRWTVELQGALSSLRYTRQETSSDFHGKDYGASLAGPAYYLSYMRTIGSGNSFQPLLGISSIAPVDLTRPLLLAAGSSNATTTINAAWNINHHFGVRGIWRGQIQTIGSLLASRFEQQEATVHHQFRKMRVEAGYLVYRYNFGTAILRRSLIFRLTRDFTLF